jgi:hypothetical protein
MAVDGGMNCDEFLQTLDAAEPFHGSLRSSKRKVGLLSPIVQPASSFPHAGIADLLHRRTVGLHLVGHQYIRVPVSLHWFLVEFQRRFAIPSLCGEGLSNSLSWSTALVQQVLDIAEWKWKSTYIMTARRMISGLLW